MIKKTVKKLLNKLPFLKAAAFIADDSLRGFRITAGDIDTEGGTTHARLSVEESVDYIEKVFRGYKTYSGIERFHGIAAEIGPGDNAGVALLMGKDGCKQVDLIDRFYSHRDSEQQKRIYKALAQKHALEEFCSTDTWDERDLSGISWQIGQPAEIYFQKCAQTQGEVYDFIVSCAVLEHLYDPLDALEQMVACLKPGGQMLHWIDFRDHGMFTPEHHELTFLQIPRRIYPWMVHNSGRPNRILFHRYRECLDSMKHNHLIDYSVLVTWLVGVGQIDPHQTFENIDRDKRCQALDFVEQHRQNFAKEFSRVDSRDLAISGIFLSVTKKCNCSPKMLN